MTKSSTSIQIFSLQSVLQYFSIEIESQEEITYLRSNHKRLGFELTINGFPSNGIVFDFFVGKQLIKKCIEKLAKKVFLCRKSSLYKLEETDQEVLVRVVDGNGYELQKESYIIFEGEHICDKELCEVVCRYVQRKIKAFAVGSIFVLGKIFVGDYEECSVKSTANFSFGVEDEDITISLI